MGGDARRRAEQTLRSLQSRLDSLDAGISRLEARDDDEYERWSRQANQRRYQRPETSRLLDVRFELVRKAAG